MMICLAAGQQVDTPPGDLLTAPAPEPQPPEDGQPPTEPAPPDYDSEPPQRPPSRAGTGAEDQRPRPAPRPAPRYDLSSMLASRGPITRLASVPNMFGDSFFRHRLTVSDFAQSTTIDLPPVGGASHVKISDNARAMPTDRVYFSYNHFHNAVEAFDFTAGPSNFSLDRYTIGLEKTFADGLWSAELRLPFTAGARFSNGNLVVEDPDVDNLALIAKRLLYRTDETAVAVGLGLDLPTADDVSGLGGASSYTLHNEALHLAPFLGFAATPDDRFFCQAFLQVDVVANGARIDFGNNQLGILNDQTLLYADLQLGRWLYRDPTAYGLNALAAILEFHYTTTLQDADTISGTDGQSLLEFGNLLNRIDLLHMTVGLQAEFGMTALSVGGVLPLQDDSNRVFDTEVQVFVNRRF